MKKILLLKFMLIAGLAFGQKQSCIVLPEDEEMDPDHSVITPTATGATWDIVTTSDYKTWFLYNKTTKRQSVAVDVFPGEFITSGKESGKQFFRINSTGEKYGPYDGIQPKYDEEKKILYGYSYWQDSQSYYVDVVNNKTYGPYTNGGIWFIDDKNLVYSNTLKNTETQKDEVFLFENDKKYGPYESVNYKRASAEGVEPLITWKENGKTYVNAPQCKGIAFMGISKSIEIKGGWLIEAWEENYKERKIYLPNGTQLEYNDKVKHAVNARGEYLKMELVAGSGSYAAFKLTYKEKEIGTYAVQKWNREELNITDFFDHHLMKVDIKGNWSNGYKDVNYVYSAAKGLLGPFSENEMRHLFLMKDGYAMMKSDSTLEINGQKVMDQIVWAEVKEYPATWWAFQKRGDYVYPFKNGVEVTIDDVPQKLKYMCTYANDYVKVQRKDEFYIRPKGSEKLMGPVGQFDPYIVSPNGKYWATERGEDGFVVVNGKPIAKGNQVVYNEKLNAFHWFVLEGQKVSLYTYKLTK